MSQHADVVESQNDHVFSLDWLFEPVRNKVDFSSFCALIFCILMNYPRFDGIWQCIDSQLSNASVVPFPGYKAGVCLYFLLFYTLRKKKIRIKETVIFEGKKKEFTSDHLKNKFKKKSSWFMQLVVANHSQSKSWVPYNTSAFGTKKLLSWINRCLPSAFWLLGAFSFYLLL